SAAALLQPHRNEDLGMVTLDEQRNHLPFALLRGLTQLVDGLYRRAIHAEDDAAGAHTSCRRRALDPLHAAVAFGPRLFLLVRRELPQRQTELLGCIRLGTRGRDPLTVFFNLDGSDGELSRLAVAPDFELHVAPGLLVRDDARHL